MTKADFEQWARSHGLTDETLAEIRRQAELAGIVLAVQALLHAQSVGAVEWDAGETPMLTDLGRRIRALRMLPAQERVAEPPEEILQQLDL